MTVKELIEELQKLDPETKVFVQGYEDGYSFPEIHPLIKRFSLDVHQEWYYGPHELDENGEIQGVILKRIESGGGI